MKPSTDQPAWFEVPHLTADLAAPLYPTSRRDRTRTPREGEVALGDVVCVEALPGLQSALGATWTLFQRFLEKAMDVSVATTGFRIALAMDGKVAAPESFRMRVSPTGVRVVGSDVEGVRRGLFRLEQEMTLRGAPVLPLGEVERTCVIRRRISRSPIAPYRWSTASELLCDEVEPYPDAYLARLARSGINGIWVTTRFKHVLASRVIPELGPPHSRLEKLAALVRRAARHGIGVYYFCMEPRITLGTDIFEKYPDIRGAQMPTVCSEGETAFCSSAPRVHEYIRDALRELFTGAPGLAGVIHLFAGERSSGCTFPEAAQASCPRCSKRDRVEVLADFLNVFRDGIAAVAPNAELLAWDYMPAPYKIEAVSRSHPDVVLTSCFEHGGRKVICGAERTIDEYSLSYVGPSHVYREGEARCRTAGRRIYAKVQLGNTYELSSAPHIPVPTSVYRKFKAMQEGGTTGALVSWIIGGAPSMMLDAAGEAAFAPLAEEDAFLLRLAAARWGESVAETVRAAWSRFSEAFDLYPMQNPVFYFGPLTRCPSYQLHLEKEPGIGAPYNWGLDRERNTHPWEDDPLRWCGKTLTPGDLVGSFRHMADMWQEGVALLERAGEARAEASGREDQRAELAVASAIGIQFSSCANVIEFYTKRMELERVPQEDTQGRRALLLRMREVAVADRRCAEAMHPLCDANPWIGFESEIYSYSFSPALLNAKITQTHALLDQIDHLLKAEGNA